MAEKRMIDANEIEELFYKQIEYGATDLKNAFDDALQDAPTVDAVEVVRCKDCKYWNVHPINGKLSIGKCLKLSRVMGDTSFCSYGERRTDDG